MKITGARVIVCCPGRNFVTLKIETDQGLTGLGDGTHGRAQAHRHRHCEEPVERRDRA